MNRCSGIIWNCLFLWKLLELSPHFLNKPCQNLFRFVLDGKSSITVCFFWLWSGWQWWGRCCMFARPTHEYRNITRIPSSSSSSSQTQRLVVRETSIVSYLLQNINCCNWIIKPDHLHVGGRTARMDDYSNRTDRWLNNFFRSDKWALLTP